ncbi:MAG TPA: phosphatidylinositol mannoside acyltransferase [Actinomycetota bacterium]
MGRGPPGAKSGLGAFEDGTALALRYYAFRGGAWLAERLPLRLTDAVANVGGRIAFRLAKPPRREVVARNMARVAGGPGGNGETLVKGAYLSYARYWLETFRLGRYSRQELLDMVDGVNVEIIDRAVGGRTGLLAVLPHFGFYDLLGAWAGANEYPLTTVAEVLKPRALYEWFAAIRERRGIHILPARPGAQTLRGLLKVLADGEIVALVADRDLSRRGIWVDYFGERTTAPVGPALLAARTGVPLAAVALYQTGPERFRCEVTSIPYERTGDETIDLPTIAQAIAAALEEVVRKAPEQYHLFSTNWPSDEPGLPPRGRSRPAPQEGP